MHQDTNPENLLPKMGKSKKKVLDSFKRLAKRFFKSPEKNLFKLKDLVLSASRLTDEDEKEAFFSEFGAFWCKEFKNLPELSSKDSFYSGVLWILLFDFSEEPWDLFQAIKAFEKSQHEEEGEFMLAQAKFNLAEIFPSGSLLQEALIPLEKHFQIKPLSVKSDIALKLARGYHLLFELQKNSEDFKKALSFYLFLEKEGTPLDDHFLSKGKLFLAAAEITQRHEFLVEASSAFVSSLEKGEHLFTSLLFLGQIDLLLSKLQDSGNYLKEAEKKFLECLEIDSASVDGWFWLGNVLFEEGVYFKDTSYLEKSIEAFERALAVDGNAFRLWHGLAISHFALGEMQRDILRIERSLSILQKGEISLNYPHVPFYIDCGIVFLKFSEISGHEESLHKALSYFEKAIANEEKEHPDILYHYATCLDYLGDFTEDSTSYEKAIKIFLRVLELDANHQPGRFGLALALVHLGEVTDELEPFVEACRQFEILSQSYDEDELVWNEWGVALMHIGEILHDPIHPEERNQHFKEAEIKLSRARLLGNTQAFYNLACLHSLWGNLQASLGYLELADQWGSLPVVDDLMHDEWLFRVRETEEFRHFLAYLSKKE